MIWFKKTIKQKIKQLVIYKECFLKNNLQQEMMKLLKFIEILDRRQELIED